MPRGPAPTPTISPTTPDIHTYANGLALHHSFLTPAEEAHLINEITSSPLWDLKLSPNGRRFLHYGPHFDYSSFSASSTSCTPAPAWLTTLLPRLPLPPHLAHEIPDQFTIQYYPPGTGIPPHVDTHSVFGEALWSLSLGGEVPMEFRKCGAREARRVRLPKRCLGEGRGAAVPREVDATEEKPEDAWEIFLPGRSLLLMAGDARFGFTHKIKGRTFDVKEGVTVERMGRYSVTMRKVRRGDEVMCLCAFPGVCDARVREEEAEKKRKEKDDNATSMESYERQPAIEEIHTGDVYSSTANSLSQNS